MYWFAIALLVAASFGAGFCACCLWLGRRMQAELAALKQESDRLAAAHDKFMQMLVESRER